MFRIDWTQNFNRYTYCLNNPLRYVDRDGEFFWAFVGVAAFIGGVTNVYMHRDAIKEAGGWNSLWKGLSYFGTGAVAGGVGAAVGMGAAAGFGGLFSISSSAFMSATTGFLGGATFGGASGLVNGFLLNGGNALLEGKSGADALTDALYGAISQGISGALVGGVCGEIYKSFPSKKISINDEINLDVSNEMRVSSSYQGEIITR